MTFFVPKFRTLFQKTFFGGYQHVLHMYNRMKYNKECKAKGGPFLNPVKGIHPIHRNQIESEITSMKLIFLTYLKTLD